MVAGGLAVVVESSDPLSTVTQTAVDLMRHLDGAAVIRGTSLSGVGFQAERVEQTVLMPPELQLPDHFGNGTTMTTADGTPEQRPGPPAWSKP